MVRIEGGINIDIANGVQGLAYLYKNGSQYAILIAKRSSNAADEFHFTYSFVDYSTSATDYYEIFVNVVGTMVTGAGNWWSGQIVY